jgi:antitoxin (DNA-binding transcriptional repressor) of toxin-antitoxin stability system
MTTANRVRFAFAIRQRKRKIGGMKTVTITEAKKHLGAYLKESVAGQNIGIICGNRIVALRPVEVTSMDFDQAGDADTAKLTAEQKDRLYAQLKKERKEAKRRRKELLAGQPSA